MLALYFIADSSPTPEEFQEAEKLGIVRFRNARLAADPSDFLEDCDAVAGMVPERYLDLIEAGLVRYLEAPEEEEVKIPSTLPPEGSATAPETKGEDAPSPPPAPWAKNAATQA